MTPSTEHGRAALPHPAPTLGDDAQAHERIRMTNLSGREPALNVTLPASPRHVVSLAAAAQHRPPQIAHCVAKSAQRRTIHGHAVITEVPHQDRAQVRPLIPNGPVHASPQFYFQSSQLSLPPLAHRLSQHREVSLPGLAAAMRKTQKVERLRFVVAPLPSILFRIAAKLDDARFVGMQLKTEPRESLAQFCQKPFGLVAMLKSGNESSRPGESHPQALTDPDMNVSAHPALTVPVVARWSSGQ